MYIAWCSIAFTEHVQYNTKCAVKYSVCSIACVPGVPRLHHEVLDDPVDWAVVVVALHGQLHEVPACQRRLLAPQLHVHITVGRLEQNLAARGGLRANKRLGLGVSTAEGSLRLNLHFLTSV
jgi:hypothetical protein